MPVTIYHNPRCSKSRQTLELIRDAGFQPQIIEYMNSPPSVDTLRDLLTKLGLGAADLVRRNEAAFREMGLSSASEETLLEAMSREPKLIQRPIVVRGRQARLGRPPEDVLEILE
ncbi:arsenate reductase (glutaredoxin) [Natronospira bacteriovora]|uniref:Arsenate reductase n=1 Tax=Natronospira bacteriovora TaxID=3069753 RepID=A0ABU0W689_9GAMM|nr:arsenate reductase (glutaredoxin) [Natronospira sp. AB-CW4]MDQ2069443.1 arsenate reductase (glutaredoxin) [Natronospira sp. AB-CW4]